SAVVEFLASLRQPKSITPTPRKELFTAGEVAALLGITPASVRRMAKRGQLASEGKGRKQHFPWEAVEALLSRRVRGIGAVTSNHYLGSIKAFTKWLVKDNRSGADSLVHLERLNPDTDLRHQRRALTEEAFGRFIDATGAGKDFRGLSGADRLV